MSHLENYYKYYNLSRVPATNSKSRSCRDASRSQRIPLFPRSGGSHGKQVDAEPLKDKTANKVLNGFVKIYRRNRIKPPTHRIETDSGSEFTNDQQSYAERAIQAIQEPLLKRMVAQELKTGVTSVEWSEDFRDVVNKIDEIWQRNPQTFRQGHPKCQKDGTSL
ncbi:hypothetical protein SAMD00019534_062740 [Rhizophagus irregularis DAOM 181602=DAOM 197198]|nr:hypothetical protein SAMD00019534_062740 [Rhizophagus irregularis DAOM 181602=DAOM 197198]